ncbi:MAG: hypothetical protein NC213_08155 [Acetobacter sp.]|nr:hypothetical protein [Bacteroides sp.]MCM1341702.1 hypothetical protein [Acetobacter sp.]MCM1432360.1 hypothetical protein [Clostridiales bacterium]
MNNFEEFKEWIDIGNEVEFTYKGDEYSVTYGKDNNGNKIISFCRFYCKPVDFKSVDDFMNNSKIENEYLKDIWDKVVDIYIY